MPDNSHTLHTVLCSGKENLGRQPHLITPENEGGDRTSYPSPPKFFDDPDVPSGPSGPPERPGTPGRPGQPGLPSGWPPAPSPAGDRERVGPESTSRERLPLRPSSPEPQLIPIPVNDGDDDQPTQAERDNGDGLDRMSQYTLMHKFHRNHKFDLWLIQKPMMYQIRTSQI